MDNRSTVVSGNAEGDAPLKIEISAADHRRALCNCIDVPEASPSFPMAITEVGITGKTVWINLSPAGLGLLPFTAEIHVDLDADRRGIHMSRIEQAISELYDQEFTDLRQYALLLCRKITEGQQAAMGKVHIAGRLPFRRQTTISRRLSIDTVEVNVYVQISSRDSTAAAVIKTGAAVFHLTACPCTQVYNEVLFRRPAENYPQPTHSQRSKTGLLVETQEEQIGRCTGPTCEELIDCLADALHVSQDLLKRPDEADLVLKAHQYPQFAEDTVRETARAAGKNFRDKLPAASRIIIESLSLESIHIHDVHCKLQTTMGEILAVLDMNPA